MTRLRIALAVVACAPALGLPACGGDDERKAGAPDDRPAYSY